MKFAKRLEFLKESEIREILKVTQRPEVISFAGGLPAPELFPIEQIKACCKAVLEEEGIKALQYSTTEGVDGLRTWIAQRMNKHLQTNFDKDNILITHGSQQAIDLSGKVFLDEGDVVLCESPTYLAALSAFRAYGCEFLEVETDEHGMLIEDLEKNIKITKNCKLIYVIPDFQNPTGRTWNVERRVALVELAARYDIAILEDNPYGELRFEGEKLPSISSYDKSGQVLCCGTFSKIFCPGYRIGWIAGNKEIIRKYVVVKQGTDLQCNTLAQMEILKFVKTYDIETHIEKIRKVYRRRRNLTLNIMNQHFPKEVTFTHPEGGLFIWVSLPQGIDTRDILEICMEQNVAFVPGESFFAHNSQKNHFRINFSNMDEERLQKGLMILATILNQEIKKFKSL